MHSYYWIHNVSCRKIQFVVKLLLIIVTILLTTHNTSERIYYDQLSSFLSTQKVLLKELFLLLVTLTVYLISLSCIHMEGQCFHSVICSVTSVVSDSLPPHGLQPIRFLCPWDFPGTTWEAPVVYKKLHLEKTLTTPLFLNCLY